MVDLPHGDLLTTKWNLDYSILDYILSLINQSTDIVIVYFRNNQQSSEQEVSRITEKSRIILTLGNFGKKLWLHILLIDVSSE